MTQVFESIEGKLKLIVLHKLVIADQKCGVLRLVSYGQSVSRTLKQRCGYFPAFD